MKVGGVAGARGGLGAGAWQTETYRVAGRVGAGYGNVIRSFSPLGATDA